MDRRQFLASAAALGISGIWAGRSKATASRIKWREDRASYPQGVASGDPDDHSVILWTRRPFAEGDRDRLTVEVALDSGFRKVVATTRTPVLAAADWTCRVLVGGLSPATTYWYRFTDDSGAGSRVGRTITAPRPSDARPVRFAFVSCNSVNEGAQNAYRRMIWEDERAPADRKLGFVLHLGDFIYEVFEKPAELPQRYSRTVYDLGPVPDARKVSKYFYVPTNLAGYRHIYRAHIDDPDIQDARAHFPFVCIGDNHEFSWLGWQSFIRYPGSKVEPAQPLRVAANQAWWEYIPSRVRKASGAGLDQFRPPAVAKAAIDTFDDHGFGTELNNRTAVGSMTAYRAMRYGKHVDLILTDHHSYKAADPTDRPEATALDSGEYPVLPQEWLEITDGGRAYNGGNPPATISIGDKTIPNFRKDEPAFTVLGREQKAWLKDRLTTSTATWKIWGVTNGPLDQRTDAQNLPAGFFKQPWMGKDFGNFANGDFSNAFAERAEIYDLVRDRKVSGFVTVSGDRHSFWAGYAAPRLPPAGFNPVGLSFITGSISAPGMGEAVEYQKPSAVTPLLVRKVAGAAPEHTVNLTIKRGVRAALEYAASGDIAKARALTNPDVAPHVEFVDMAGHGYTVISADAHAIDSEFVCIVRPIARATTPDGGPLRYRVSHRAPRWKPGQAPKLEQRMLEGDAELSV
ncbi:alkaline phosphatase D family protein [Sphingomonas bacterium]|uniref:alkaline phosphatase D family protein n=1 Tax=Sphingomonas bacterium TaxID=1895847 RepID=UPI002622FB87|nr:alkaline phosphatase D family protein [Sphingomonas bacterium]MDB5678875.1 phosphodiesterase [Sphingomonas bacterium]